MAKFLILNQPPPHPTKISNVAGCVRHFQDLDVSGRARVFPIAGSKGYATIVDVVNHDELSTIVDGNPMNGIEQYQIIALRDIRF
jgi:hypothetical protein